jgi:hypothetical protein
MPSPVSIHSVLQVDEKMPPAKYPKPSHFRKIDEVAEKSPQQQFKVT